MMLAGAVPALLAPLVVLFVPESRAWAASMRKATAGPLREVLGPSLQSRTLLAVLLASVALLPTWGAISGFLPLWADQMAGADNPLAKAQVQVVLAIGAVVGCLLGAGLGQKAGRRRAYFLLCLASLAVCGVLYGMFREFNAAFLIVAGVVGMTTAAFYGWFPLYLPELFPARAAPRARGWDSTSGGSWPPLAP